MIVLGFHATLISYTGAGTLWPTYDTNPVCQKDWWWYLLYINNFETSDKQCMTWCWYLAADMQFYIISPLFMVPLIRWPRLGCALILACISGSCVTSFLLTYQYNLIDGFSRLEFHLDDSQNFMIQKIIDHGGLVVRYGPWSRRIPDSKPDFTEDPSCIGPVES
ncbi:hypothetical protein AVEN_31106-1 [Araneus ventricosus]|uniref:Acyltransferase 3 domain-containing protein n=1 Tax=Araneus ventricosus TaxID=182803 RepID=A0A4Y2KSP5_ARAVE|nr:hypothetical protein AVEN_31106-1 [Araneus ventricosus]